MRSSVAVPGVLAIMVVLIIGYYAPPRIIADGAVSPLNQPGPYNTVGSIGYPASSFSLFPQVPVTVSYSNLPLGSTLFLGTCPSHDSARQCYDGGNGVFATASSGVLTLNLGSDQKIIILSTSQGVTYQASVPWFAGESEVLIAAAIAGLAVMLVGILLSPVKESSPDGVAKSRQPQSSPESPVPPKSPLAFEAQETPSRVEGRWIK